MSYYLKFKAKASSIFKNQASNLAFLLAHIIFAEKIPNLRIIRNCCFCGQAGAGSEEGADCLKFWSLDYGDDKSDKQALIDKMAEWCFTCSPPKGKLLPQRFRIRIRIIMWIRILVPTFLHLDPDPETQRKFIKNCIIKVFPVCTSILKINTNIGLNLLLSNKNISIWPQIWAFQGSGSRGQRTEGDTSKPPCGRPRSRWRAT